MAADTFSNTLGYLQMQTGNDNNSWGTQANNAVFQIFEDAIVNTLTSAVTGGALDLSTNAPPIAASQVRFAALIFTGALTLNQTLYVPNIQKFWWVNNQTSGAFTLNIQTKNGSSVIGSGSLLTLGTLTGGSGYTNGTYYNVPLTGGSGSGGIATVVVSGGAVASVTITSRGKQYLSVDTLSAAASSIGGTGSGFSINVATVGNVIPQKPAGNSSSATAAATSSSRRSIPTRLRPRTARSRRRLTRSPTKQTPASGVPASMTCA